MSRPRKGGTLFGHSSDCYNWDNRCHCGSDQPFLLPPEELMDTTDTNMRGSHTCYDNQALYTDHYNFPTSVDLREGHVTSRGQYRVERQVSQGREAPAMLGHGAQCFQVDNRCHCSSNQPYLLPPEGGGPCNRPPWSPPQQMYGGPQYDTGAANINSNTSAAHRLGSSALPHSQYSTGGFGTGPQEHLYNWDQYQQSQQVTSRTEGPAASGMIQSSGLYSNDQLGSSSRQPGQHNLYDDDDLPPSYEQLFPDKYNPS